MFPFVCVRESLSANIFSSFYPGYSPDTEIYIEAINGLWKADNSFIGTIEISPEKGGYYSVVTADCDNESEGGFFDLKLGYEAKLFRVDNVLFVDLLPMSDYLSDMWSVHVHNFAIIEFSPYEIRASIIDPTYIERYFTKAKNIGYLKNENYILLTEPPATIQKILLDVSKEYKAQETIIFKRISPTKPLQPTAHSCG